MPWDGSKRRAVLGRARCVRVAVLASALLLAIAGAVQWQAPAGCPEGVAVERRVEELLGRVPAEHELRAVGVVSAGPPWRLELETTIGGRRQQRVLEAEDCRAVAEAAALILAVSVDPLGVSQAPAGPEELAGGREEVPDVAVLPAVGISPPAVLGGARDEAVIARERPRARPRLALRVGAGGEAVAIPGGTGGVRLGLAVEGERAFLQLEGSYWIDRLAVLRDEPTRSGARVGLGTVAVQGGVRLGGPRVGVPLMVGVEAGGLRTRAEGLARGQDVTLPWVAGVVGGGVQWSLSRRVALWGAVEGVLPFTRLRVRVGRAGADDVVLHEPAVVGARALAGISIRIAGGS
jgi:hypothetical protein